MKFIRHNDKSKIYSNKRKLKGTGISITESLTKIRLEKLKIAREKHGFRNVWTMDGKIYFKSDDEKPTLFLD